MANNPFEPKKPQGEPPVVDAESQKAYAILKAGIKRRALVVLVFLFAVFLYRQCVVVTDPGEYNLIMQFGEIKGVAQQPGVSFKLPLVQSVRSISKKVQMHDIKPSNVITQDKKTMVADSFVLWKVSDPQVFIRQLSGNQSSASNRIETTAYNSMKNVISRMPQSDIISGRDTLADTIADSIGDSLNSYGLELVAIETKHLDLPPDNKQAVHSRMISERNNIAASYEAEGEEQARKIRTETDKTVAILLSRANATAAKTIAEGEQQYMETLAEAYNDEEKAEFYSYVRALDAAKASLNNGDTTLILSSDSPIAQIFYNAG